jgi:hypothetical protein
MTYARPAKPWADKAPPMEMKEAADIQSEPVAMPL